MDHRHDARKHSFMENKVAVTSPEQNKALVLEAFDKLFNKRDYAAAAK